MDVMFSKKIVDLHIRALKSEYAYQQFKENFISECDSNITSDIKTSAVSQNKIYYHFSFHPPKFSDGS